MHIRVLEHVRWLHKNVDLIPFSSSSSSYMWWQFQHIIKLSVPKLRVECNQVTSWARFNQWALGWILPSGMLAAPISTSLNPWPSRSQLHGQFVCGLLQQSWCNLSQTRVYNEAAAPATCELGAPFWGLGFFEARPYFACILDPGGRQLMATDDNKRALTASE